MLWLCRINTSKILQRAGAFHWLMISISLTRFDIFTGLWWWSYWGQDVSNEKYILNFYPQAGFFFFFSYNFIVNCFAVTERDLRNGEKYWLIRYLVTNLKEKQSDLALNKSNDYTTFSKCMNCIYFTASYGLFYLLKLTCTVQIVCYVFSLKQM